MPEVLCSRYNRYVMGPSAGKMVSTDVKVVAQ